MVEKFGRHCPRRGCQNGGDRNIPHTDDLEDIGRPEEFASHESFGSESDQCLGDSWFGCGAGVSGKQVDHECLGVLRGTRT